MPQLKKKGVKPLLSTSHTHLISVPPAQMPAKLRKPLRIVDVHAEPLSSSDSEIGEIQLESRFSAGTERSAKELNDAITNNSSPAGRLCDTSGILNTRARFRGAQHEEPRAIGKNNPSNSRKRKRAPLLSDTTASVAIVPEQKNGESPNGQKDDPDPALSVVPDKDEAAFNEMCRVQTNRKNRRKYGTRLPGDETSNLHTPLTSNGAVAASKGISRGVFQKPVGISGPSALLDKQHFHVPGPLQETYDKPNKKVAFKVPVQPQISTTTSKPRSFKASGLSNPSSESSSALSSPPDSDDLESSQEHYDEITESPMSSQETQDVARCPMCKAAVEPEFLESHSKGKKLRLKAAMDFCIAHKQRSAHNHWEKSEYPSIEWDSLGERFEKYNGDLQAILENRVPSVYRRELVDYIASSKSSNPLGVGDVEGVFRLRGLTGYYGTRGARKMMEHIMATLATEIRAQAGRDRLFMAVGVSGFVQAVLVPELVVLLVKEDVGGGCDDERAKAIINESAEVGDLVNEEEDEWVDEKLDNDSHLDEAIRDLRKTRSCSKSVIAID